MSAADPAVLSAGDPELPAAAGHGPVGEQQAVQGVEASAPVPEKAAGGCRRASSGNR